MQQFSMVCMIADHDQRQIEYVCVFSECNLSRLACSKCVKMFNHKHQQQDQSHVLDHKELYEALQEKLSHRQKQQSMVQNHSEQLKEMLLKLRNNGFNQFDYVSINLLLKIDQQVGEINTQLFDQSNSIIKNAIRIQEWCYSQQQDKRGQEQKIIDAKSKVITLEQVEGDQYVYSSAISNDFKYIVSGGTKQKLKIWNYSNNKLIKSIQLDDWIYKIKFTDDSRLLYVGNNRDLYQFDVNNNFKETYKESIHQYSIYNIFCITNTIILTSSSDKTIIKTDVNLKQQLFLIEAHDSSIYGFDYNHNLDMIASSGNDDSIKIWNCQNGQLVLEKQNAHSNKSFHCINQVLFIIKGNKLISLDYENTIFVWKINYETKQLEQQHQISDDNNIYNISLILNQQYITLVCSGYIKIYSIQGDFIKQFNHDIQELWTYNTIQPQSMKPIAIQGEKILKICKLKIDLD